MLRKAFGGAFIAMNSRDLGADYTFAWPQATLGVMGAKQAVGIVNRRDIAAAEDPEMAREEFAARYTEEHLSAGTAAAEGYVDEVIDPARQPPPSDRSPEHPGRGGRTGRRDPEHSPMTKKPKPPAVLDTGGRVVLDDGRVLIPL